MRNVVKGHSIRKLRTTALKAKKSGLNTVDEVVWAGRLCEWSLMTGQQPKSLYSGHVETLLSCDLVNNTLDLGLAVSRSCRVKLDRGAWGMIQNE